MRRAYKIVWVNDWIESIPRLGLGIFEFVASQGVIHHLKSPVRGLRFIHDVQSQNGGANLMVYGKHGRQGVYQIQGLLQIINGKHESISKEIRNAKIILKVLPKRHWFSHVRFTELVSWKNSGIYDILLHKRDVAYSVEGVYQLLQRSNYDLVDFSLETDRIIISLRNKMFDELMYDMLMKLSIFLQRCIGELIYGRMIKQDVYASKQHNSEANFNDDHTRAFLHGASLGLNNVMEVQNNYQTLRNRPFVFAKLAQTYIDTTPEDSKSVVYYEYDHEGVAFAWPFTKFGNFVIASLARKGKDSLTMDALIGHFNNKTRSRKTSDELKNSFRDVYSYLKDAGLMLLKKKSIKAFPKTSGLSHHIVLNGDKSVT